MIRPIDITLNAAHPELPLVEATTFTGAPSSVFIRGVPKAVGNWSITAVSVAVTYPDNTTTARAAVESAEGVWVATIPGTATSGRTAAGFRVMADGIDENGDAVTGYVLGFADFSVLSFMPVPAPGDTFYLLRYFDQAPATPKEGDAAKIDGVLKFYNGTAWEPFAAPVTLDNTVTPTSGNGVKSSGIWSAIWGALAALPAGFTSLYDWCVAKLRDKLDLNVYGFGNATVALPDGFSITYYDQTYTAPVGGETIIFVGPVPSSNPYVPNVKFYYPLTLGTLDAFDPNNYSVWCLVCSSGGDTPDQLMYKTGPSYSISGWNSAAPTLTLSNGEATGDAPTMTRPIAATSDTLAKVSQMNAALAGKLDKSGGTMTGAISFDDSMPSGGPCSVYYNTDQWHFKDHMGNEIVTPKFTGGTAALTSDIPYNLTTKTISNNAVTLSDRAINAVAVSSSLASLTINFPTATSGKARDFGLRLTVASGITTAPELALPQGVTCENAYGEAPEIGADGAATILYFTETASGVFLVKGEVVTAIS